MLLQTTLKKISNICALAICLATMSLQAPLTDAQLEIIIKSLKGMVIEDPLGDIPTPTEFETLATLKQLIEDPAFSHAQSHIEAAIENFMQCKEKVDACEKTLQEHVRMCCGNRFLAICTVRSSHRKELDAAIYKETFATSYLVTTFCIMLKFKRRRMLMLTAPYGINALQIARANEASAAAYADWKKLAELRPPKHLTEPQNLERCEIERRFAVGKEEIEEREALHRASQVCPTEPNKT